MSDEQRALSRLLLITHHFNADYRGCYNLQNEHPTEQGASRGCTGKVEEVGREEPTFFLTNNRPEKYTAREVVQQYAQRNLVENGLGEDIKFFHLDCLSSGVRLNADFEMTLSVVADLLYRMLAWRLNPFSRASPQKLYRKFIDSTGSIEVEDERVHVRLCKRAHNPLINEADLTALTPRVPWLGSRPLLGELP